MANWYKTGTVNVTNGSTAVVGSGSLWLVEAAVGDMFTLDGATWYEVAAVNSNTSLTLGTAYAGATATGAAYAVVRQLQGDLPVATLTKMSTLLTLWRQREEEMVRYLSDLGNVTVHDVTGVAHVFKSARQVAADLEALLEEIDGYNLAGIAGQIAAAVAPKVDSSRAVSTGVGLTGGGSLAADRTIALGTPSAVSGASTNTATGATHTHEVTKASTTEAQAGTGTGLMTPPLVAQQIASAIADQTTAETGTNNAKLMTPQRVAQQVTARVATQPVAEAGADNTALMTALRVYQQVTARVATQPEAEGGANSVKLLTPQRAKQLIDTVLAAATQFVRTAGATMAGALTLAGNATEALHAVPKQQLDSAIANLPAPQFTKFQDLGWQTITAGGALTLTHTLGAEPKYIRFRAKCTVANLNYAVGDIIEFPMGPIDAGANYGIAVWATSSAVNLRFGTNANTLYYINKTTGAVSSMTNASWQLGVTVWA